jgi:ectoine hydroxylase-related dioxygenase (phytanoyl-CoA dioxygenase family)
LELLNNSPNLKKLSPLDKQNYAETGFVCPVDVLTSDEVKAFRSELEDWERSKGSPIDFPEKSKSYLLFNWADQLVHHPVILDAVEDLIGPDILVYHSTLFLKEAHSSAFVRWHQDSTYFYLDPHLHVTAWVALSRASVNEGCMHAVAGSHLLGAFEHDDQPSSDNMIRRGQGISHRFEDEKGVAMPLEAGQMSLHHTDLVHASGANHGGDRRIGFAISYIPSSVKPTGKVRPSALCVRGKDHGNFLAEKRLQSPLSKQAYEDHKSALALFRSLQDAGFVG